MPWATCNTDCTREPISERERGREWERGREREMLYMYIGGCTCT